MVRKGFTLLELLVVIAIIGLLALLGMVAYTRYQANAKLSRLSSELADISIAITQYAEDNSYQYPSDVDRGVPPGLERYLAGGVWPASVWPHGQFDWDNWPNGSQQVYQMSYHLCHIGDPASQCVDPILFPTFTPDSTVFYCVSGPCIPHQNEPNIPGYCVNCEVKKVNY